jgi:hypothetical protein
MKRVVWGARPSGIPASIPERVGRAPHGIVLNEAAISDVVLGDSFGLVGQGEDDVEGGAHAAVHGFGTDDAAVRSGQRGAGDWRQHVRGGGWVTESDTGEGLLLLVGIELCERVRETTEVAAEDRDVVRAAEVGDERRGGQQALEVLGEDLAAAASALAVLQAAEEGLERVVCTRIGPPQTAQRSGGLQTATRTPCRPSTWCRQRCSSERACSLSAASVAPPSSCSCLVR